MINLYWILVKKRQVKTCCSKHDDVKIGMQDICCVVRLKQRAATGEAEKQTRRRGRRDQNLKVPGSMLGHMACTP